VNHAVSNTDDPTPCPVCGQKHGLGDRNKPKIAGAVEVDPRTLAEYAGRYRFFDGIAEVTIDGKNLRVGWDGNKGQVLAALPDGAFTAAEIPDYFTFRRDARGRVDAMITNVDDVGVRIR
jgi:hypothetical protein